MFIKSVFGRGFDSLHPHKKIANQNFQVRVWKQEYRVSHVPRRHPPHILLTVYLNPGCHSPVARTISGDSPLLPTRQPLLNGRIHLGCPSCVKCAGNTIDWTQLNAVEAADWPPLITREDSCLRSHMRVVTMSLICVTIFLPAYLAIGQSPTCLLLVPFSAIT